MMSGVRNGVQALMKKENSSCLYVHCFAHSLNLCIQHVVRKSDLLSNCIEFILQLVQLIKFSPKRLTIFEQFRKNISLSDDSIHQPSLRPLCPTRWTVRHSAINSILINYQALKSALDMIQQGTDEYSAKGRGLLMQMESFDIFFSLKLGHLVNPLRMRSRVTVVVLCVCLSVTTLVDLCCPSVVPTESARYFEGF